jgi:hypothetical protein
MGSGWFDAAAAESDREACFQVARATPAPSVTAMRMIVLFARLN